MSTHEISAAMSAQLKCLTERWAYVDLEYSGDKWVCRGYPDGDVSAGLGFFGSTPEEAVCAAFTQMCMGESQCVTQCPKS